jgi:hypothetical protein
MGESISVVYRIEIEGALDGEWTDWFGASDVVGEVGESGAAVTVLTGEVADQAALRGLLERLWDLNLVIISVARVDDDTAGG